MKYWGKRDLVLNLPATGSISVTLDRPATETTVRFDPSFAADVFVLNGREQSRQGARVTRFLDLVRTTYGITAHANVETTNDFPTGAGLASSASGFAALALACNEALGLGLTQAQLSVLARRGSGSAARSFIDGFAEMRVGDAADGSDAFAVQLAPASQVPLRMLVAVTTTAEKTVGSTEGMRLSEATSPFYGSWMQATTADLSSMREAILSSDLEQIGTLAESNCLRMHAVMLGSVPPLIYWNAATLEVMLAVRALRAEGLGAWFTIDAGPQVKVLCAAGEAQAIEARLAALPGVQQVIATGPGRGAYLREAVV